ncbi:hypothetical protein L9F63_027408, partial [Diploptera punctata]
MATAAVITKIREHLIKGWKPEPAVRWLVNGVLVDEEYEHNTGDVIENRLMWPSVGRQDLNSCVQLSSHHNTVLTEPREISLVLDIYLRPLTIRILSKQLPLVADRRYEVSCESAGSRPPAVITWYKGKRQLRRVKEETRENVTVSDLSFVPTTDDDGKAITCRAENPNITGAFLEDSWKIEVVFPPIVSLMLGSTLNPDDIKEGDDVYFECHVKANPGWRKLTWLHNWRLPMNENFTFDVNITFRSLSPSSVASGRPVLCRFLATTKHGLLQLT